MWLGCWRGIVRGHVGVPWAQGRVLVEETGYRSQASRSHYSKVGDEVSPPEWPEQCVPVSVRVSREKNLV